MEDRHLMAGQSIIRDLMTGMYKTVYKCLECNNRKIMYEIFLTLPVYLSTLKYDELDLINALK